MGKNLCSTFHIMKFALALKELHHILAQAHHDGNSVCVGGGGGCTIDTKARPVLITAGLKFLREAETERAAKY